MTRKKKRTNRNDTPAGSWFETSETPQLFLWRVEPDVGLNLLGGNHLGYQKLQKALQSITEGEGSVSLSCRQPSLAPPIQWHNSPLARRKEAPIHEIERDLRGSAKPFQRFIWYRRLTFVQGGEGDTTCQLRGDELRVELGSVQAEELQALIGESTFPMFGGVRIAQGKDRGRALVLAGDWIGAE